MKKLDELKWQLAHVVALQTQVESRCQTLLIVLGGMFVLIIPKIFNMDIINIGIIVAFCIVYFLTLGSLLIGIYPQMVTDHYFLERTDNPEHDCMRDLITNLYQKALEERKALYKMKESCLELGVIGVFCLILIIILSFSLAII